MPLLLFVCFMFSYRDWKSGAKTNNRCHFLFTGLVLLILVLPMILWGWLLR